MSCPVGCSSSQGGGEGGKITGYFHHLLGDIRDVSQGGGAPEVTGGGRVSCRRVVEEEVDEGHEGIRLKEGLAFALLVKGADGGWVVSMASVLSAHPL